MVNRVKRAGWNEFVLMSVAGTFLVAVTGFIFLARIIPAGEALPIEQTIMRGLRQADDPGRLIGPWWVEEVGRDISALGGAVILIVMTLLVLGYLLLRRGYAAAVLVVSATVGGYFLSVALKDLYGRARPNVVPHLSQVNSESFPSGHSMLASVVYLTLGALLAQTAARRREKIYFIHAAFFLSVLIGCSRVVLGVHYPTDVLAGWGAGTAWALLCWSVAYGLQRRGAIASGAGDAGDTGAGAGATVGANAAGAADK